MPNTTNSDFYLGLHEELLNFLVLNLMRKRPSMFNYVSRDIADHLELLCQPIARDIDVEKRNNPLVTLEDPIPLLGSPSKIKIPYCVQLTKLIFDFYPTSRIQNLPLDLKPPLKKDTLAIQLTVLCGIGIPSDPNTPATSLTCFTLDLYALAKTKFEGPVGGESMTFTFDNVEIVDIAPAPLESAIEKLLLLILQGTIQAKLKVILKDLTMSLGDLARLQFKPAAGEARNPAIDTDRVKIFLDIEVS